MTKLTFEEFVPLALRTESTIPEEGVQIDLEMLTLLLEMQVTIGTLLDYMKKGIFYNNYTKFDTHSVELLHRLRNLQITADTATLVGRTTVLPNELNFRVLHGILGSATENSELVEVLIKHLQDPEAQIDTVNVSEEIADDDWYKAILVDELNIDRSVSLFRVIEKLKTRYPEKFSAALAANRDLETERRKLEGN